jgi:polyhydroxyalkanoate synthase
LGPGIDLPVTGNDVVRVFRLIGATYRGYDGHVTFLLTSGGHNAGIVREPGREGRSYRIATRAHHDKYLDANAWEATAPLYQGSWWPAWQAWLANKSGERAAAPPLGAPDSGYPALADAPGSYVLR